MRLSALGDVVLATALVKTLRANFPNTALTWITSAITRELLGEIAGVEYVIVPRPMRVRDYVALRQALRGRRFDVLLAAQASFRANLVHACVPARRKIGFDARRGRELHGCFVSERIPYRDEHLADGFLAFAGASGVPAENYARALAVPVGDDARAAARRLTGEGRYFVINPAASKAERVWRLERYAAVARHVAASGWRIVLTGAGGAEKQLADALAAQPIGPVVNLAGRTSVRELAAVIAGAEGILAPDTGPVHIASAVGTPVIGLYAVARSALTGPWPERRYCVDRYAEAAAGLLGKSGAGLGWHTRVHDARAMDFIAVEEVCAQFDRLRAERMAAVR